MVAFQSQSSTYQCKDGVTPAAKQVKIIGTNMAMFCRYKEKSVIDDKMEEL